KYPQSPMNFSEGNKNSYGHYTNYASESHRKSSNDHSNPGIRTNSGGAQHLASLTFIVPREYIETLSILQDRAPYRGMNDVKKIFAEEFNGL
ncbi:1422_t:CDS:2, partial [Cetraspora pellucida]